MVEVLFVVTRLVAVAFTAVRLDVDALVKYPLVAVIPVPDAVLKVVCPVTVRVDAVVVASVEVPVTARVPCEIRDVVAVIDPPVSVLIVPVRAFNTDVKRLVDVALSITPLVA